MEGVVESDDDDVQSTKMEVPENAAVHTTNMGHQYSLPKSYVQITLGEPMARNIQTSNRVC